MGTYGDYLGEVAHALADRVAEQAEPVRDRLVPQAATPSDLPEPRRGRSPARQEPPAPLAFDPGSPLFLVLDGPGVIGL
ncbi:MAG: hypothetical protein ACRC20_08815 [Segniliparus sp.]|uniref:hypothetical protein n=1 Tax=Segniliparus sp. TaxID=2804064 RepID=UPI003F2CB6CE